MMIRWLLVLVLVTCLKAHSGTQSSSHHDGHRHHRHSQHGTHKQSHSEQADDSVSSQHHSPRANESKDPNTNNTSASDSNVNQKVGSASHQGYFQEDLPLNPTEKPSSIFTPSPSPSSPTSALPSSSPRQPCPAACPPPVVTLTCPEPRCPQPNCPVPPPPHPCPSCPTCVATCPEPRVSLACPQPMCPDSSAVRPAAPSDAVPPGYVAVFGVGAYKMHKEDLRDWLAARDKCADEGGHLMIPNSQDEADVIAKMINENELSWVHIGINDLVIEGDFTTVLGQPLKAAGYAKWASDQPNGGRSQNCCFMWGDGALADGSCSTRGAFVCELPFVPRLP